MSEIYHVIMDTSAGSRALKKWNKYQPLFQQEGKEVEIQDLNGRTVREACAECTAEPGEKTLLVIGGDGILNEAINGVRDLDRTRIAYLPAGSANDFARAAGILHKDRQTIQSILDGREERRLDLGEVCYLEGSRKKRRYFLVSTGFGYDAEICAAADASSLKDLLNKVRLGKMIYLTMAVKLLLTTPMIPVKLMLDRKREIRSEDTLFAVCMNHRFEGGGFAFCPDADPTDGKLDLCMASHVRRLSFFRIFPTVYKGNHGRFSCIHLDQAERISMKSAIPLWLHVDGEAIARTREVHVRLLPGKIRIVG